MINMIKKIDHKNMGRSIDLGWLDSHFHFSFAEYFNRENMNFGVMRVLNDDLIGAGEGFDLHPHRDMEIVSYVVNGELTHGDTMGNRETLKRGEVQYMSAGTGVYHSEHNLGENTARLLQIWIYPIEKGLKPNYGDYRFKWEERENKWLHLVSKIDGKAPVRINQDVNIYATNLEKGKEISFEVAEGRQAYLVNIEGLATINGEQLVTRDAMEAVEESLNIRAEETLHLLVLEMEKQ
jgi:redox-sensitive bicupin YhaK (pirin superfamily)